ncbi:hypothetical protein SPI_04878 [Niveomyces insectorum RCEF 264]|uniref:Uncharacterized protein n=1 Tax=Niveomyces insectorum RCEF 264 TaxID=1081102 RepID=A0A167UXX5_9HYPO|nr:hypothetical protein SPI_04878 [Niveomyces insectorum RCEF 264]
MCFLEFIGYTCGHTSLPVLRPCPLTTASHTFPTCPRRADKPFLAGEMCSACQKIVHSRATQIEEYEHRFMHERGVCGCPTVFPYLIRPRTIGGGSGGSGSDGSSPGKGREKENEPQHQPQDKGKKREGCERDGEEPHTDGQEHQNADDRGPPPVDALLPPLIDETTDASGRAVVAVRLPSLYAAEWVGDHRHRHAMGLCHCRVDFRPYQRARRPLTVVLEQCESDYRDEKNEHSEDIDGDYKDGADRGDSGDGGSGDDYDDGRARPNRWEQRHPTAVNHARLLRRATSIRRTQSHPALPRSEREGPGPSRLRCEWRRTRSDVDASSSSSSSSSCSSGNGEGEVTETNTDSDDNGGKQKEPEKVPPTTNVGLSAQAEEFSPVMQGTEGAGMEGTNMKQPQKADVPTEQGNDMSKDKETSLASSSVEEPQHTATPGAPAFRGTAARYSGAVFAEVPTYLPLTGPFLAQPSPYAAAIGQQPVLDGHLRRQTEAEASQQQQHPPARLPHHCDRVPEKKGPVRQDRAFPEPPRGSYDQLPPPPPPPSPPQRPRWPEEAPLVGYPVGAGPEGVPHAAPWHTQPPCWWG